MFNKQQLIETMKNFSKENEMDPKEFLLGGSTGLVMSGLMKEARDIDAQVERDIFEYLKTKHPDHYKPKPYAEGHPLAPGVLDLLVFETALGELEVMVNTLPFKPEEAITEGIRHLSLAGTKEFKLWLGREKDIKHLKEVGLI